jgi:hypothetical protein
MRRWIALLLMLLLPLQVSWSVAAEYGTHGATLGAPHAELHAQGHVHADAPPDVAEPDSLVASSGDTDTGSAAHAACCDLHQCHTHGNFAALTATAGLAALASMAAYATEQVGRLQSLEATSIERPQWAGSTIFR